MNSKRKGALWALAAVLAVGAFAVWWFWLRQADTPQANQTSVATQSEEPSSGQLRLTEADATRLETALNSGDPAKQAELLLPEYREPFLQTGKTAIPAGSTANVKLDTATVEGAYAEVDLEVSGAETYRMYLIHDGTQWFVDSTTEK